MRQECEVVSPFLADEAAVESMPMYLRATDPDWDYKVSCMAAALAVGYQTGPGTDVVLVVLAEGNCSLSVGHKLRDSVGSSGLLDHFQMVA